MIDGQYQDMRTVLIRAAQQVYERAHPHAYAGFVTNLDYFERALGDLDWNGTLVRENATLRARLARVEALVAEWVVEVEESRADAARAADPDSPEWDPESGAAHSVLWTQEEWLQQLREALGEGGA